MAGDSTTTTVLVAGATGNQGGAVARTLLSGEFGDFEVHALTRDPTSEDAKALERQGATPVEGDLDDTSTLIPLIEDVDAVFGVTNFWQVGYDGHVRQGTNLAEAAAEAGVDHFVFSGVGGSDRDTGVPHFDSCDEIETRIEELGLPATFLRPVFFLQNFEAMVEDIVGGTLAFPIEEDTNHQMVDVEDLGRVAAQVLADPDTYIGQARELAGDEGTLTEIARTFSDVLGTEVEPVHVPIPDAREAFGDEWADMCQWFIDEGYSADIQALGEEFGPFTTLEEYLEREGWSKDKSRPAATPGWVKAMHG